MEYLTTFDTIILFLTIYVAYIVFSELYVPILPKSLQPMFLERTLISIPIRYKGKKDYLDILIQNELIFVSYLALMVITLILF